MDQIFTPQFWQDVIAKAPWVIPALLVGGLVGWKWKGANDDGEIRGLRAGLDAPEQRLELAREKYDVVVDRENDLNGKIARQEKAQKEMIADLKAELKKARIEATQFVERLGELPTNYTEIKNAFSSLSTSTSTLGEVLTIFPVNTPLTWPSVEGLPFEQKGDVDLTKRKDSKPNK